MSKTCITCGAPHNNYEGVLCQYCNSSLVIEMIPAGIKDEFPLIKYEFLVKNYKRASALADTYLKRDPKNIPAWGYKILASAYTTEGLNVDILNYNLRSFFDLHLLSDKTKVILEKILFDELYTSYNQGGLVIYEGSKQTLLRQIECKFTNALSTFVESIGVNQNPISDRNLLDRDSLFEDSARLIVQYQSGSTSLIQRRMKLGYNRAGRLMDQLEIFGIVGPAKGIAPRDVLIHSESELELYFNQKYALKNRSLPSKGV
jgi:hypothetical protein